MLQPVKGRERFSARLCPQNAYPTLLSLPIAAEIIHVQLFGSSKFLHSAGHCYTNGKQPQLETCPSPGVFFLLNSAFHGPEQEAKCEDLWAQTVQLLLDTLQRGDFCCPHSRDNRLRSLKSLPGAHRWECRGWISSSTGLSWLQQCPGLEMDFDLKFAQA